MKRAEWQAHHGFTDEDMERIGLALGGGATIVAVLIRPATPGAFVLRNGQWRLEA